MLSYLIGAGIRTGIRLSGQRVQRHDCPWLDCPMGEDGHIGSEFYDKLVEKESLERISDSHAGLLENMSALDGESFDSQQITPCIRDFYETTSDYKLEAWSESNILTRFFLWGLTSFVSRQMDQLNFPVSSLELARGMTSEVIPLLDQEGNRRYTGWLRKMVDSQRVIYTGLYSVATVPGHDSPCVKVSFPLPYGSATVFLRPEVHSDGSLRLISSGRKFGDPGFYRMVRINDGQWVVRYLRTLREHFHVFIDSSGTMRTDHSVSFLGMSVLKLHYRMDRIRVSEPVTA